MPVKTMNLPRLLFSDAHQNSDLCTKAVFPLDQTGQRHVKFGINLAIG